MARGRARGQLPVSVLEAALGVVLVTAVAMGFALGVPGPDRRGQQLDRYAEDTATLLREAPPRHGGSTRLSEVVASADSFARERAALERRVDRILPENVMFRVETPRGAIGYPVPDNAPTGTATVTTTHGPVRIRVWYA